MCRERAMLYLTDGMCSHEAFNFADQEVAWQGHDVADGIKAFKQQVVDYDPRVDEFWLRMAYTMR